LELLNQSKEGLAHAEAVAGLKQELAAKGVGGDEIDELLDRQGNMLVAQNQVATALALHNYFDMQMPEFNRLLPEASFKAWRETNRNLGRGFFQQKFKERMQQVLDQLIAKTQAEIEKEEKSK
jgi:hypothetical protein